MEFVLVFVISLLVLLGVALALAFGRAPTYRPSRPQVLTLLVDVMDNNASVERWDMFLSLPITHDPELEKVRLQCLAIVAEDMGRPTEGINGAFLDKVKMGELRVIAAQLNRRINSELSSKLF